MLRIIKAAQSSTRKSAPEGGFVDLSDQVDARMEQARQQAERILTAARELSAGIRADAEQAGRDQAARVFDQQVRDEVQRQLATIQPALQQAIESLRQARADHLKQCESGVLRLASAIAQRLVRRELRQTPEITLDLVREALELAAGSRRIRIQLNPDDYEKLGKQAAQLGSSRGDGVAAEIQADASVSPGGCIVQTEFGTIDQRFESQLARILEELV